MMQTESSTEMISPPTDSTNVQGFAPWKWPPTSSLPSWCPLLNCPFLKPDNKCPSTPPTTATSDDPIACFNEVPAHAN